MRFKLYRKDGSVTIIEINDKEITVDHFAGEFNQKREINKTLPLNLENLKTKKILKLLDFSNFKRLIIEGDIVAICRNETDARDSIWFTIQKLRKKLKMGKRIS